MKDTDWNIIYELYKTKNITKAASNLFITQPTLTKRLQIIEDELGAQLVVRSSKGILFTVEGEFIASQATKYMRFWDATQKRLESFRNDQYGTLRIVSAYTYVKYHIAEALEPFLEQHPNVALDIRTERSDAVERCLLEGRADVGFVRGEYGGELRRTLVMKERAYLISSKPLRLDQLRSERRIDSIWGEHTRSILDRWWRENFKIPPRVDITTREADTCWQMASRGLGYTVAFLSEDMIRQLGVYALPLSFSDGTAMERNTWFLYRDSMPRLEYIEDFITSMEHRAANLADI